MAPNLLTVTMAMIGFFIGIMFPVCSLSKISFPYGLFLYNGEFFFNTCKPSKNYSGDCSIVDDHKTLKVYEKSNPKGAETIPPGFVVSESDLYQHRLWGNPNQDLANRPIYLVAFTVGYGVMKQNVNNAVKKFSDNFTIILFHYDDHIDEWDEYDWSRKVIHISAKKQTKWWYAKRFMHPDIVAPYEYIFIWDEDLGVDNFDSEEYIKLVKKYGLEISQPAVESHGGFQWRMTERKSGQDIHKEVEERAGWCPDPHLPPCAGFVEIMAPVFSKNAWRCVWHMIQNDLVHGWGLDFSARRCVEPAYEKMGVVDAQWIFHHAIPTLLNQGQHNENTSPEAIRNRCRVEWKLFDSRMKEAENKYYKTMNTSSNSTS